MVNRKTKNTLILLSMAVAAVIATGGCSEDGEHQPVSGQSAPDELEASAQIASSPRLADIQPILKERCNRCHSAGPLNWNDSENLNRVLKNGVLLRYMETRHMPLAGSPEAAAITDAERDKIVGWAKSNSQAPSQQTMRSAESAIEKLGMLAPGAPFVSTPFNQTIAGLLGPPIDKSLVVASRCMSCHGNTGMSASESVPNLAGHSPSYISTRLKKYLQPGNSSPMATILPEILRDFGLPESMDLMQGRLDTPRELESLFTSLGKIFGHYSVSTPYAEVQKVRDEMSKADKVAFELGRKVARIRCAMCHLTGTQRPFEGVPMIHGQKREYLRMRMQELNLPTNRYATTMGMILADLSPEELNGLAVYFSATLPTDPK